MNTAIRGEFGFAGLKLVHSGRPTGSAASAPMIRRATVPAPPPGSSEADERIRRTLLARIEREPWWRPGTSKLVVQKGKVIYQGLIADAGIQRVARRIAEAIPGVCGVWHARSASRRERHETM